MDTRSKWEDFTPEWICVSIFENLTENVSYDYRQLFREEFTMLLLSRKQGESIRIADKIEVRVLEIRNGQVKLGIDGPRDVPIRRHELYRKIKNAQ